MSFLPLATPAGRRRFARAITASVASVALIASAAVALAPAARAADDPGDASVSGVLTGPGGVPLGSTSVDLYKRKAGGTAFSYANYDYTAIDGSFSMTGLDAGTYTIRMGSSGDLPGQYLGGVATSTQAQTFVVAQSEAKVVNMLATAGRTISGRVTGLGAAPISGAYVRSYRWVTDYGIPYWESEESTSTDANGNYTIEGVLLGEWTVRVQAGNSYAEQWYGGVYDDAYAKRFAVTAGADRTGINLALKIGGSLTGVITAPNGAPAQDVEVVLIQFDKDPWGFADTDDVNGTMTETNGTYMIGGIAPGQYTLVFYSNLGNYKEQFLGGVTQVGGATRFTVGLGQNKSLSTKLRAIPFDAPSVTKVALSKSARPYGTASTATVSVTGVGTPKVATGSVKLTDGSKVVGTKALVGGKATFTLPAKLSVGKHKLKATFTTNGALKSSSSATTVLTVTKAKVKVKAKATKSGVAATVTASGFTPTGKVVVKRDGAVIASKKLRKGKASLALPAGEYKVTVVYLGSSKAKAGKSGAVKQSR